MGYSKQTMAFANKIIQNPFIKQTKRSCLDKDFGYHLAIGLSFTEPLTAALPVKTCCDQILWATVYFTSCDPQLDGTVVHQPSEEAPSDSPTPHPEPIDESVSQTDLFNSQGSKAGPHKHQ